MNVFYAVDRFEGETAVLVGDDGSEFMFPKSSLPTGTREGSILRVPFGDKGPDLTEAELDEQERRRREVTARDQIGRLRRRDPGGDVRL